MMHRLFQRPIVVNIGSFYEKIIKGLERFFLPLLLLAIRFWMARIFWYSGLAKLSNWQGTLFLFQHEYKVPMLPFELTAYLSVIFELCCPLLLGVGLAARLATLPMLAMTAVIQLTYLDLIDHFYWAMLLGVVLGYGPGTASLDQWVYKMWKQRRS